ncbi:unnamed protein product [Rotaria sordida]|uniref:Uncharacterized protein n=1 Tax=Rotaria sordida TaxID=392033 RepID=A0A813RN36_9BILA|nr:unnamed protein product [Rotaria sordida]
MPIDTTICAGTSYTLTIPQPSSTNILWNDGTVGNTHVITGPASYTAIANNIGCIKSGGFNVAVQSMPVVNLGNDTLYCSSKPNTLKLKVNANVINYLWNNNSIADTLKIAGPGTYWVRGSANGCMASDTIVVGNNPANSFTMPIDTIICSGTSYNLTLPSITNTNFLWNDGAVGNTHLITGPATYSVVANSIGCLKNASYNVATKPTPIVKLGNDTLYCTTKPNTLKLAASANIIDYLWNNSSTADSLNITGPGTYWLRGTANGCTAADTINVADNPVNVFVMPNDTTICDRSSYHLILPQIPNTNILWNDGAIGYTHLITGPKNYNTVANNIGCLKSGSYTVSTKPLPIVSLGNDTTLCNVGWFVLG